MFCFVFVSPRPAPPRLPASYRFGRHLELVAEHHGGRLEAHARANFRVVLSLQRAEQRRLSRPVQPEEQDYRELWTLGWLRFGRREVHLGRYLSGNRRIRFVVVIVVVGGTLNAFRTASTM